MKLGGRTHGKTTEIVLREVKAVHDNLLYDKFVYVNSYTKVTVGCKEHGYFDKWPNDLKHGSGCAKCSGNYHKTHLDFLNEMQDLYPHIRVIGRYSNAKTKIDFECTIHGYCFDTKPNQILTDHINCPECVASKSMQTKLKESKSVTDPADKTEYELYKRAVWRFSNRTYKKFMSEQIRDRQNHLDHVLSIVNGFRNDIVPEILGSIHNLRIISGVDNRKKSYKSDITVKELMEKYYA